MKQPEGFIDSARPSAMYRLLKSLYGLRQAPRLWNEEMHNFLVSLGFVRISADPCVYTLEKDGEIVILGLYVDDNLIAGNTKLLQWVRKQLASRFSMKDLGEAKSFLNMECIRVREKGILSLRQSGFIRNIINEFNDTDMNPTKTPMIEGLQLPKLDEVPEDCRHLPYRCLIGKLLYAALATRPDISYAVNYLSRFVPGYDHHNWDALKWVVCYLAGTVEYGITYSKHAKDGLGLKEYGNADWGSNPLDR